MVLNCGFIRDHAQRQHAQTFQNIDIGQSAVVISGGLIKRINPEQYLPNQVLSEHQQGTPGNYYEEMPLPKSGLCKVRRHQIHGNHQQYGLMKDGSGQHPQDKFGIVSAKHIFCCIQRNGQGQVVAHGIQAVKIVSVGQEQKQSRGIVFCLVMQGLHKEEHCKQGEEAKYGQVFIVPEYGLNQPDNQVKAKLRGYVSFLHNQLEIIPVHPVIVSNRNPTGTDAGQQNVNSGFCHQIPCLFPAESGIFSGSVGALHMHGHILPIPYTQRKSHRKYHQQNIHHCTPFHGAPPFPVSGSISRAYSSGMSALREADADFSKIMRRFRHIAAPKASNCCHLRLFEAEGRVSQVQLRPAGCEMQKTSVFEKLHCLLGRCIFEVISREMLPDTTKA